MCWSLSDATPQFKAMFTRYWPNKNLIIKIKVKFFTSMVENLNGKRLTWWPSKFLYSKCVVAWTLNWLLTWKKRGKLQADIANMGLQVMLLLTLLGNITVRQFHVNSAKIWNGSMWTKCPVLFFNWSKIWLVLCKHSLRRKREEF